MDIFFGARDRTIQAFSVQAQGYVYDLIKIADIAATRHIKDHFLRVKFRGEVKTFVNANLRAISDSRDDSECREAIDNIKRETNNIRNQSDGLTMGKAKIYLTISMEKHNKEIGYLINGIWLVTDLGQFVGGFGILSREFRVASVIGKVAVVHYA